MQEETSQPKESKTIYSVSIGSIFFRNFISGFARALGGMLVYLILGGLIYYISLTYIVPKLDNLLPSLAPLLGPTPQNLSSPQQQNYPFVIPDSSE